ncbi:hypothetical protein [Luteimonas suaedae]|uniref:hypothetical protein n=1 Tax=Luteimonas suaedae TaxID=2605430 RepID=UPI0011F03B89|nr:hypothetical protein [Luteimonas suaedae]
MATSKTTIAVLLGSTAFAVFSLVSGAPYLEARLPGGLPIGNVLAALGLCSLAGAAVALSPRGSVVRGFSWVSLALAIAWLPVSIALAGNLELTFGGGRGTLWITVTLATAFAGVACLGWALAWSLWKAVSSSGAS